MPPFSLPMTGGGLASSAGLLGRQLVLFFYPKASTEACTDEAVAFSSLAPAFERAGTALFGISADTLRKQENFRRKFDLAMPLVSDVTRSLIEACGLWVEKQMFGHRYWGIERTTVLIDRQGRIARVWSKVKVPGHAAEVLAAAQALHAA